MDGSATALSTIKNDELRSMLSWTQIQVSISDCLALIFIFPTVLVTKIWHIFLSAYKYSRKEKDATLL